uniref:Uncharacterized protein n=1 Tax=Timema genevievae TaxID=629358 RepID=A0A7R9PK11_TIMGE|nr:unnamed protein product [Timema genevievae]
MENHLGKTLPSSPDRDSNLELNTTSALANYATELANALGVLSLTAEDGEIEARVSVGNLKSKWLAALSATVQVIPHLRLQRSRVKPDRSITVNKLAATHPLVGVTTSLLPLPRVGLVVGGGNSVPLPRVGLVVGGRNSVPLPRVGLVVGGRNSVPLPRVGLVVGGRNSVPLTRVGLVVGGGNSVPLPRVGLVVGGRNSVPTLHF